MLSADDKVGDGADQRHKEHRNQPDEFLVFNELMPQNVDQGDQCWQHQQDEDEQQLDHSKSKGESHIRWIEYVKYKEFDYRGRVSVFLAKN